MTTLLARSRARVMSWIQAACRVVEARDEALISALAHEARIARTGVIHVFEHVLPAELHPSARAIEYFVARAKPRPAVAVVLSANVFSAPVRSIAWALAQAPIVTVRPSSRSSLLVNAILAEVEGLDGTLSLVAPSAHPPAGVPLLEERARQLAVLVAALPSGGAVHAYGSADLMAAVRAAAARRPYGQVETELHGPGWGAMVASASELIEHAGGIADDVVAFDQRGCLSPRVAFSIGTSAEATKVADAVFIALCARGQVVPRVFFDSDERREVAAAVAEASFLGRALLGDHHVVLDLGTVRGLPRLGGGRTLPVISVPTFEAAARMLEPVNTSLTTIGTDRDEAAITAWGVRISPVGRMQAPPLDGPVDLRGFTADEHTKRSSPQK